MLIAVNRRQREEGFTLVEVLVALVLFAVVAGAAVPLLAIAGSAAVSTRSHTRAKNLAQERVEQMRQLPFQVDKQNGDFRDVLDYYYPNRVAAVSSTSTGWVATGAARVSGEPSAGSFYRTRIATLPNQPGFSQTVAVQFLDFNRVPLADDRYASYDHMVAGFDASPSTLLGVTVMTYWTHAGKPQTFRTFTQISDGGDNDGLLIAQANSVLLRVESALPDGASITSELLSVTADGRLSDGSVATARATAGRATRTGVADLVAANAVAVDPVICAGSGCPANQQNSGPLPGGSSCGYASFGRTRVDEVSATTADGMPRVPADVNAFAAPAKQARAKLLKETGHACGAMSFDNKGGFEISELLLGANDPVVAVAGDAVDTGSTPIATSSAWVNSTAADPTTGKVAAGATTGGDQSVRVFKTAHAPEGLLKLRLVSASLTCDSSAAAATGSYSVLVQFWNADAGPLDSITGMPTGAYRNLVDASESLTPVSWTSTAVGFVDPLAGLDLTSRVVYRNGPVVKTLADYLDGPPQLATAVTADTTTGLTSIGDAILSLTTKPLRGAADPLSSVGLKLGTLSCVAVDQR